MTLIEKKTLTAPHSTMVHDCLLSNTQLLKPQSWDDLEAELMAEDPSEDFSKCLPFMIACQQRRKNVQLDYEQKSIVLWTKVRLSGLLNARNS